MPAKSSPPHLTAISYAASLLVHSAVLALALSAGKSALAPRTPHPGTPGQTNASGPADSMRDQVKELLTIEAELQRTRAAREAQYRRWSDREKQRAPAYVTQRLTAADQQMQTADSLLQRAAQQQAEIKAATEALAAKPSSAPMTPQAEAMMQKAVRIEQATIRARDLTNAAVSGQRDAIKTIDFAGNLDAGLRPALQNSVHLGEQAGAAQTPSVDAHHAASEALKNWRDAEKALEAADAAAKRAAETAKKAAEAAKREEVRKARAAAKVAETQARQARGAAAKVKGAGKPPGATAPSPAPAPRPPEIAAQKPEAPTKPIAPAAPAPAPSPPADTPEVAAKRNDARQKLAAALQALNAASQAHTQAAAVHTTAKQAAQTAHTYAESHLPAAEGVGPHGAEHGADIPGPSSPAPNPAGVAGGSSADLYAMAVESEQHSAEAFRHIRGVEAAMADRVALENALANLDSQTPVRPALRPGGSLTDLFASQADTDRDTEQAQNEVRAMLESGRRIRARVQNEAGITGEEGSGPRAQGATVSLSALNSAAAVHAQSEALAQEDDAHPARDLTAWMKAAETHEGQRTPNMKPGVAGGSAALAAKPSPQPGPDVVNSVVIPTIPPAQTFRALPGRRMAAGGTATDWMFVDSWYIVGPFPNPQRANINRAFPPETDIDLDARYIGKDNRTVRWRFAQAGGPLIIPPDAEEYAIYYGTTELWFDAPRDLWIAVGSDDKSHVWIDGQLVWVSSDVLKGWRLNEGWRKVHFKQGRNRVLFRLENGWRGTGFSLLIHTR